MQGKIYFNFQLSEYLQIWNWYIWYLNLARVLVIGWLSDATHFSVWKNLSPILNLDWSGIKFSSEIVWWANMPLVSLTPRGFYPRVIWTPSTCLRVVFMSPSASIIYKTMVDAWITEMSVLICFCSRSESESCSVVSNSLRPHGLYSPWNSPGHNNGVGSQSLLQGIFPTQGWNPGLLHCRQIL